MMKIGLCVFVMLCCSCHRAASDSHAARGQDELRKIMDEYLRRDPLEYRSAPPGYDYLFRGPLTISQIEQETLDEVRRMIAGGEGVDVPEVPFGRMNDKWMDFKEKYKPGDDLYFFRTDQHSWDYTAGRQGYALLRRNRIVEILLTRWS